MNSQAILSLIGDLYAAGTHNANELEKANQQIKNYQETYAILQGKCDQLERDFLDLRDKEEISRIQSGPTEGVS